MKKIIPILSLALSSLAVTNVSAQSEALHYDLKDCIKRGLANNLELEITRGKETIAHNNATLANAGALPSVDASAGFRPNVTTLDRTVARSTGDVNRNTGVFDRSVDVGVSLSWTLFDGFKIQTNYKQLKTLEQQGETATRMAIEDLVSDITSEYYGYIRQMIRCRNYQYAMALSRERLRIASINYQTGRFSGLDYHQSESDFRSDSATYVLQQEALKNSNIRLNHLMGNTQVEQLILLPDSSISINPDLLLDELWQKTLSTNTSLLMADQNTLMAEQDYKKALARNYPYLRLNAQYGYSHYNYDISSTRVRDNLGLTSSLTLGFNIFDGNRKRERDNAKVNISNQKLRRQQLELDLRANLTTLWNSYRNNLDLLSLQHQNLEIAQQNLEIAMDKYKLGNLSGFDMRQVEKNLLDAEERVLQAEYDAKLCEISLLLISGDVMRYME